MAGAPRCPHPLWVTASLGWAEEDQCRQTHTLTSLSLETNAGSSLAAPFPLLTFLSDQPVDSSPSPASVPLLCPLVKSQEMPQEQMLVRCTVLGCASPFPPLTFSLHPQRLGRDRDRLGPSPTIHITNTHHHPMRKKKKSRTKKSFVQRYIFIIQSLYRTKNERKKGVHLFFHYCR